jgi:hypothetical protein
MPRCRYKRVAMLLAHMAKDAGRAPSPANQTSDEQRLREHDEAEKQRRLDHEEAEQQRLHERKEADARRHEQRDATERSN